MLSNADVIAFYQLLLEFTLGCSGILAQPQGKGEDSRQRGGGEREQTEKGGGSFNCWVQRCNLWGDGGVDA